MKIITDPNCRNSHPKVGYNNDVRIVSLGMHICAPLAQALIKVRVLGGKKVSIQHLSSPTASDYEGSHKDPDTNGS